MNFSEEIDQLQVIKSVSTAACELGYEAYIVGGFVRDLILKRPSKDIDFVCIGSGIDFARKVMEITPGARDYSYFKNFGTAKVEVSDWHLEFVGARKESYRKDSRKPIVEDGTLSDDQKRRDFTINTMAIGINKGNYGVLIDPFNGVEDLNNKMLKTPLEPSETFSDDPLRMMRAIRFASQLSFDIDTDTFEAIIQNANRIKIVSSERIVDELNKIIESPVPSYGLNFLFRAKLMEIIFPEMCALHGVETKKGKSHKDNFFHTLKVLDNIALESDNLWLRWAAIMHDIAKPVTKRFDELVGWTFHGHEDKGARMVPGIFKRLKLPLDVRMKFVQKMVRLHLRPISLVKDTVTDAAIRRLLFESGNDIDDLMKLCRADITSKNNARVKQYLDNFNKVERKLIEVEDKDRMRNFQPPVKGEEIMKVFNLKPSKIVGEIKEQIKDAILDGKINNNYDEAFKMMIAIGKKKGLQQNTEKHIIE